MAQGIFVGLECCYLLRPQCEGTFEFCEEPEWLGYLGSIRDKMEQLICKSQEPSQYGQSCWCWESFDGL